MQQEVFGSFLVTALEALDQRAQEQQHESGEDQPEGVGRREGEHAELPKQAEHGCCHGKPEGQDLGG